jgi:hypothetical protein
MSALPPIATGIATSRAVAKCNRRKSLLVDDLMTEVAIAKKLIPNRQRAGKLSVGEPEQVEADDQSERT